MCLHYILFILGEMLKVFGRKMLFVFLKLFPINILKVYHK